MSIFAQKALTNKNMTTTAIRKKVHQYVDDADDKVLKAMYSMLKIYVDEGEESLMSREQKTEIDKRSKHYRQGKLLVERSCAEKQRRACSLYTVKEMIVRRKSFGEGLSQSLCKRRL